MMVDIAIYMLVFMAGGMIFEAMGFALGVARRNRFDEKNWNMTQFLDHSESAYLDSHDDFSIAMMRAKPRISNLAIDLVFEDMDWRCVTKGEIARAENYALILGKKEKIAAWWREKRDDFILDHGSFHAKNEIRKRRAFDAMGVEEIP